MFQDFSQTARPEQGPPRLAALRREMEAEGLAGFLVPRADAHQGEYVAPHDDRLAWLTGFTGSAGYCVALKAKAGVFVDSRYRVQVKAQVADVYTPVDWPEVGLAEWIAENLPEGGDLGFDPWLFSLDQIRRLEDALDGVTLRRCDNLVDRIWDEQPEAPMGAVAAQPLDLAGEAHEAKIDRLAEGLEAAACIITLPDSIAWLLNIRGTDIPRNPVPHGFALLNRDGTVELFMDATKLEGLGDHLGDKVKVLPPEGFIAAVATLGGRVQLDPATCPVVVAEAITVDRIPTFAVDPTCGGGAFLLGALDRMVELGVAPSDALGRVGGLDLSPGAVESVNQALRLWAAQHGLTGEAMIAADDTDDARNRRRIPCSRYPVRRVGSVMNPSAPTMAATDAAV